MLTKRITFYHVGLKSDLFCPIMPVHVSNYFSCNILFLFFLQFLFWSGVYSLVMRYSDKGRKFYTISDTLTGKIINIEMKKANTDKQTNNNNRTKTKSRTIYMIEVNSKSFLTS